jgi:hypothetical protein
VKNKKSQLKVNFKNTMGKVCLAFLIVFLFTGDTAFSQRKKVQNLPKYDKQKFHFGFLLGVNVTDFTVRRIPEFNKLDSLYVVESSKQTGFNIGIVTNLKLTKNLDLRFIPDLAFSQRNLEYTFSDLGKEVLVVKEIESTFLQFPLDLKFKSNRINNYRVYVVGGIKYTIDMVSQAKVENKDKDFVKLRRNDYGYQYGVGFDFYMERFKFSPEIKMFHGARNLLVDDPKIFSSSLDALRSRVFLISFTFE